MDNNEIKTEISSTPEVEPIEQPVIPAQSTESILVTEYASQTAKTPVQPEMISSPTVEQVVEATSVEPQSEVSKLIVADVEPPKKKKSPMNTVIILLILILLGLGVYVVYDKFLKDEPKEPEQKEKKSEEAKQIQAEELSLDDTKVNELHDYVTFNGANMLGNKYFYKNKALTVDTFSDVEKHYYAMGLIDIKDIQINCASAEIEISINSDVYDNAIKKIFGSTITYKKDGEYNVLYSSGDLKCGTNSVGSGLHLKYNEDTKKYEGTATGVGGGYAEEIVHSKLVRAEKTSDSIILTEKFLLAKDINVQTDDDSLNLTVGPSKIELYSDMYKKNLIYTIDNPGLTRSVNIKIENYLDKANTISYIFKRATDGEYYFYSSKVEK